MRRHQKRHQTAVAAVTTAVPLTFLTLLQLGLDITLLAVYMPDILDRYSWPLQMTYGAWYEFRLYLALIVSTCAVFASCLTVAAWTARAFAHVDERERRWWAAFGCATERVPWALDIFQTLECVTLLVMLTYPHDLILGASLTKAAAALCILCRSLFPTPKRAMRAAVDANTASGRDAAWRHTKTMTTISTLVTLLFAALFLMQHMEIFATGTRLYTSDQLRLMNDDRHPMHNQTFMHKWSTQSKQSMQNNDLPLDVRVVLIVLDGMRYDHVQSNAEMHRLVLSGKRSGDMRIARMRAALPTMSAPNWATLLTGASPEVTGMHGNIFDGETEFDHLFARMARADTDRAEYTRGLTGCEWFSDLVKSYFPRLQGDGAVAAMSMFDVIKDNAAAGLDLHFSASELKVLPPYMYSQTIADWEGHTDDRTDRHRALIARQALNETRDPYRFFLVHFANIDTQAHYYGVDKRYNAADSYQHAVTHSAEYIESILDVTDAHLLADRTIVIITADHGEVDAGGHGGADDALTLIPFIVYRKGYRQMPSYRDEYQIEDVAPTVATLLGIPVPRQSSGMPIDFAVRTLGGKAAERGREAARDLFEAKQQRVNMFLIETKMLSNEWHRLVQDVPDLARDNHWIQGATEEQLQASSLALETTYQSFKVSLQSRLLARNMTLSVLLVLALLMYMFRRMQQHTLCDASTDDLPMVVAMITVGTYVGAEYAIVRGIYAGWGYYQWDSTVVHCIPACITFFLVTTGVGSAVQFIVVRCTHAWAVRWVTTADAPGGKCSGVAGVTALNSCWFLFMECTFARNRVRSAKDFALVYLVRNYSFALSVMVWCALLIAQAAYSFLVPLLLPNWIITETTWNLRFQVVSFQFMMFPLLVGNLATLWSFSRRNRMFWKS